MSPHAPLNQKPDGGKILDGGGCTCLSSATARSAADRARFIGFHASAAGPADGRSCSLPSTVRGHALRTRDVARAVATIACASRRRTKSCGRVRRTCRRRRGRRRLVRCVQASRLHGDRARRGLYDGCRRNPRGGSRLHRAQTFHSRAGRSIDAGRYAGRLGAKSAIGVRSSRAKQRRQCVRALPRSLQLSFRRPSLRPGLPRVQSASRTTRDCLVMPQDAAA